MQDIVSRVLTQTPVIEASRKFVCIRPLTYEDSWESDYLRKVLSRGGNLENTVFAIMDPTGSKYLSRPSRMPYHTFPGSDQDASFMGKGMDKMAEAFTPKAVALPVPFQKNLRYAMNVAACDRRPVVMLLGSNTEAAEKALAPISNKGEFLGQFVYAKQDDTQHLAKIPSISKDAKVVVVQPDHYGQAGTVLSSSSDVSEAAMETVLKQGLAKFKPWTLEHRSHLNFAVRNKIRWKPAVAVEDQKSVGATERLWGSPQE